MSAELFENTSILVCDPLLWLMHGGPGTGKTTILRAVVDILRAKRARLCLASPTGRAAQRLAESAAHPAQTLHRLLKYEPAENRFLQVSAVVCKCLRFHARPLRGGCRP